jgi:hypothetical protein
MFYGINFSPLLFSMSRLDFTENSNPSYVWTRRNAPYSISCKSGISAKIQVFRKLKIDVTKVNLVIIIAIFLIFTFLFKKLYQVENKSQTSRYFLFVFVGITTIENSTIPALEEF